MTVPLPDKPEPYAAEEPLITVGTLTTAAIAVLALIVAFGIDLDDDRQSAILGVVAVVAPLAVAVVGRFKVFSPYTVRRMLDKQERDLTR